MFATTTRPTDAYNKVGVETGVVSANPHKLILMLFDGAVLAVANAIGQIERNEIAAKGASISRAIDIVSMGLQVSLDKEAGGELALRLDALYDYICDRLLHANVRNDKAALEEVNRLLNELRGAWQEIADDPAVLSSNKAAA